MLAPYWCGTIWDHMVRDSYKKQMLLFHEEVSLSCCLGSVLGCWYSMFCYSPDFEKVLAICNLREQYAFKAKDGRN